MKVRTALLGVVSSALIAGTAHANVSLKNGNFFIGYTDVVYSGGFEPKIERVYNSKTAFKGVFGWGWGMEYEVNLSVLGDGSVAVNEYGGGAFNLFTPPAQSAGELDLAIERIADAARSRPTMTPDSVIAYEAALRRDAVFRGDEWTKLVRAGKLAPRDIPEGTRLQSQRFSYQVITRVRDGYERAFDNGRKETFDLRGRLVRVADKNRNWVALDYDSAGHMVKVTDNFGRHIRLEYTPQGYVARVLDDRGRAATYRYDTHDQLVGSHDVDGNEFTYAYDARHNMTRIGYADGTALEVTYYPRSLHENVRSVKDRDGTLTRYEYAVDPADSLHLRVAVTVLGPAARPRPVKATKSARRAPAAAYDTISRSSYEYVQRRRANGEEWTYQLVTVQDGDSTATTYSECCGLPTLIARGADTTRFEYDLMGHVTLKQTPTSIDSLTYDPRIGKVARVVKVDRTSGSSSWSNFRYDAAGNLIFAENSEGQSVTLQYDDTGRISSMTDKDGEIRFTYNQNSKPIVIEHTTLGKIVVTYTADGEIEKVDSPAGRKVALAVTSSFQNLLGIIRPAGVSLSF